jgi:hypothetical protein
VTEYKLAWRTIMTRSNSDDHDGSGIIIDTRHIVAGYKYFDISFLQAYNLERVNTCAYEKGVANMLISERGTGRK